MPLTHYLLKNNSFLNYNRCFFPIFKIPFHMFVKLDRPKSFIMIVSDEFLKFNSCFPTEFAH